MGYVGLLSIDAPARYRHVTECNFPLISNGKCKKPLSYIFCPATAALLSYQRVSASSSSDFDATHASPCVVISRFQNGARDFR